MQCNHLYNSRKFLISCSYWIWGCYIRFFNHGQWSWYNFYNSILTCLLDFLIVSYDMLSWPNHDLIRHQILVAWIQLNKHNPNIQQQQQQGFIMLTG